MRRPTSSVAAALTRARQARSPSPWMDRERDLEMDTETEPKKSQTRRMTAYSIKLFTSTTPGHVKNFASRADKESAKLGASGRLSQRAAATTTLTRLRGQIHRCGRRFSSPAESRR